MTLRPPRFKNEFLNSKSIFSFEVGNIFVLNSHCDKVCEAILSLIKDSEKSVSKLLPRHIGIIDLNHHFTKIADTTLPTYEDLNSLTSQRYSFDLKYLYQEYLPTREEDYSFVTNLTLSSYGSNPNQLTVSERNSLKSLKVLSGQHATNVFKLAEFEWEKRYELSNALITNLRALPMRMMNMQYSESYNLYVGGQPVTYMDSSNFTSEYLYHFLYLYLYRLYDLAYNRHQTLNICLVIADIHSLFKLDTYKSIYITNEQAQQRMERISLLLEALLKLPTRVGLNFVFTRNRTEYVEDLPSYFHNYKTIEEFDEFSFDFDAQY